MGRSFGTWASESSPGGADSPAAAGAENRAPAGPPGDCGDLGGRAASSPHAAKASAKRSPEVMRSPAVAAPGVLRMRQESIARRDSSIRLFQWAVSLHLSMDISSLTLTHLRYLVAIDVSRSFRAAAEECHVSQPTLSTQLQKLEEIVGARLFDRSRQPVAPTEVGARVIAQARTILRETNRLTEVSQPGVLVGTFHLGVIPTL